MRSETRADSRLFEELLRSLLDRGISVRFSAQGRSMYPAIRDGDVVQVDAARAAVTRGSVALLETAQGVRVHRVIRSGEHLQSRGDCCFGSDKDARLLGAVSLSGEAVPRRRLGSILRRWIAIWRGHF